MLIFAGTANSAGNSSPKAQNGLLDLSGWDFQRDGNINLNGEWEWYWQQLLDPSDFSVVPPPQPTGLATLPGAWNGKEVDGQTLTGNGFSTYRLTTLVPRDGRIKAISIKNQSSAYVLYINGQIVARNGEVGTERDTVTPRYRLEQKPFHDNSGSLEIILQVANFNHRKGGIWNPIKLGNADTLRSELNLQWIFDLSLFGCLMVMGIYYISLYVLYQDDRSPLYLAIFTLFIAARILVTGNYYLTQIFPHIPWEPAYKFEFGTIIVGPAGLLLFVVSVFGKKKRDMPASILLGCMAIIGCITLITPARIASWLVVPCQLFILGIFVYILYVLVRALFQGDQKAAILLGGMLLLTVTVVIDILSANKLIYLSYLTHFGIFFLILSQSFVLSVRSSDSFRQVNMLSGELAKKNLALERLDMLKDEFLVNTTHELRTPLNGIVGMAESLLQQNGDPASSMAQTSLKTIIASGRRLNGLINDVLDFARLKNHDVTLNPTAVDLKSLTDSVIYGLQPLADRKALLLINEISEDIPAIHGDEDRLQQILYNLIGNGIKFTEKGVVRVHAVLQDSWVRVSVSDTGIGIPPSRLGTIFSPYEQGDAETIHKYGGTGLGLPIAAKLVTLHGGTLEVDSDVPRGSDFSFTVPASQQSSTVDHDRRAVPSLSPNHIPHWPKGRAVVPGESILVVDDDPVNLQVVGHHLQAKSIPFDLAADGVEALEKVQAGHIPAVILLDIMMPKLDGYAVCRQLREKYSAAELPIILLTARSGLDNLVRGFKAGANDYITKPFARDELLVRVQTQLDLQKAYKTLEENLLLKTEIKRRKRTELDLKVMQRRLARILDTVNDAVLAVNESLELVFVNSKGAAQLESDALALLGLHVGEVFTPESRRESMEVLEQILSDGEGDDRIREKRFTIMRQQSPPLACAIQFVRLEIDAEQLVVLIFTPQDQWNGGNYPADQMSVLKLIEGLNTTRQRMLCMEESLQHQSPDELQQVQNNFKLVRTALTEMESRLAGNSNDMIRKSLAIEAMNLSLEYWQQSTGLTKADLAEQSGIWKVYTNPDGFSRTQTLDKYLDATTLPNYPKWHNILATIEFVLVACDTPSPARDLLEERALQLRLAP